MNELAGQTIKGYEFHHLIGEGASGVVYSGTNTHTGELVAVKCLKSHHVTNPSHHLERFQREGELLRQMDHPNIVKLLDTFEDNGQQFLVMEYVSGGSLRDLLNKQPQLPLENVLWIALDLADALTRAHRLDIVHRDLKPENVLLADDGTPRLTDFGIAHLATSAPLTQEGALIGTPHYLSPEVINQQGLDGRADIWSFGVMLFEMLAGCRPFEAELLTALLNAIMHTPPPDLELLRPDTPVALVDLVYRMLEKDPCARVPSVRLVGAELEALLREEDMVVRVLGQDVGRHAVDGSSVFATPTPAEGAPLHNLPVQTVPFVGRENELAEITQLVVGPDTRLVTILGPGGMGKTRLALEAAAQQRGSFERGVWFVPLAPLSDPAGIVTAIAEAVGFQFHQGGGAQRQQLLNYLRAKEMLLVLDNFEHLLDGAALVTELLQTAPLVKVLATSRARLNLGAEQVYGLTGMETPSDEQHVVFEEVEAVALFLTYAQRTQVGFALTDHEKSAIVRICRMLDGLPLGLELAAAWVRVLPPDEIAAELAADLDFLASGRNDLPERHRSMRAAFDHSWRLLNAPEQDALMKLSVFRGGCTARAARHITGASLRTLGALVDQSLVSRDPVSGRLEMHELIRQFAAERLEETSDQQAVRDAHSAYYLDAVARREADIKGRQMMQAFDEIEPDIENIFAAWNWALDRRDFGHIARACESLALFFINRSHFEEGGVAFRTAVEKLETNATGRDMQILFGMLLCYLGRLTLELDTKRSLVERSLAILQAADAGVELAFPLSSLGAVAQLSGDYELARALLQQAVDTSRAYEDQFWLAFHLFQLGWVMGARSGLPDESEQFLEEALEIAHAVGNPVVIANVQSGLAAIASQRGDREQCVFHNEQALAGCRTIGFKAGVAAVLANLGWQTHVWGDHEQARQLTEEALALELDLGSPDQGAVEHVNLGFILRALGDLAGAGQHLHTALSIARDTSWHSLALSGLIASALLLATQNRTERAVELLGLIATRSGAISEEREMAEALRDELQAQLPQDVFAAAWARGEALDYDATVPKLIIEFSSESDQA